MKPNRLLFFLLLSVAACQRLPEEGVAVFERFVYEGRDAFYDGHPLTNPGEVYNPLLPGWHSDPSICTDGEGNYFLVTSSFSYYPGVPLFHSRDLVNWEQAGYVLDRPSQLAHLGGQGTSGGIYAPDIQYNPASGTYYMVTTDVGFGNFVVKTRDPFGAWSDPILLPGVDGIDPSLFFDDDGKAYLVHNADAPDGKPAYDGHRTIRIVEYDVEKDCTVGEERILVDKGVDPSRNPVWIEGPHLYKVDGRYYLMAAEGGTGDWHSEVVFRSDAPMEGYTPWSRNPILTQRHLPAGRPDPVTCTGHADLVRTPEGAWWAVFLGCRPTRGGFENLGRETFLMPVHWSEDGFPVITEGDELVPRVVRPSGTAVRKKPVYGNFRKTDDFDGDRLGLEWMTLRGPADSLYKLEDGILKLRCSAARATEPVTPALVLRRLQHHAFTASARMRFRPVREEAAGLLLYKDEHHQYFLKVCLADGRPAVVAERIGMDPAVLGTMPLPERCGSVDLTVASDDGLSFRFLCSVNGRKAVSVAEGVDASYLSTAVAGGFTGTTVGLYAVR